MTITVGTDTYITLADANTYWSNRNNSTWSDASEAAREAALREATQYVDSTYGFIGTQITSQTLAWPRYNAEISHGNFAGVYYDSLTIPQQIKDAVCELALEALTARLDAVESRGGQVKRQKVDVIEVEYNDFAPSGKTYKFATKILKPLLQAGSSSTQKRLVRS